MSNFPCPLSVTPRRAPRWLLCQLTLCAAWGAVPVAQITAAPISAQDSVSDPASSSDAAIERLRTVVPELLKRHHVPGLTLCLVDQGAIAWSAAFGVRRASDEAPMEEQTVLEGAGLALPMLARLALQFVDEGVLDLNQPLGESPFAELLSPLALDDPRAASITPAMLLSQSSGLSDTGEGLTLSHTPGEVFEPSLGGQRLLQGILEQAGGADLQELLEGRVFAPLGMDSSSMVWRDEYNQRCSAGHDLPSRLPSTVRRKNRPTVADAPSSLHTTAADMGRFLIATLGDGGDQDAARRASLLRPWVTIDSTLGHGLGWGLELDPVEVSAFQWGSNPHFRAFALIHLTEGTGLVVLTNSVSGLELMAELCTAWDGREEAPLFRLPWFGTDG